MSAVLDSYLRCGDASARDASLSELMEVHARPVVRRVVTSRLAGKWDDMEDVCSEAGLELLLHLRRIRASPPERPIADFPAYVAAIAANACNRYFRKLRPGRARLKRQILILASEDADFVVRNAGGRTRCELAAGASDGRVEASTPERNVEPDRDLRRAILRRLRDAGGGMDIDVLVDALAAATTPAGPPETGLGEALDGVPSNERDPGVALDDRRFTVRLWQEIRRLPREQRVALLLHLRDRRGNSVLFLFPLTGVASFGEVAAALAMTEDGLAGIWNDLPADDLAIGEILGCARQRVINLRMAARKRLANRMKKRRQ